MQQLTSGSGVQDFTYDTRGLVATRAVSFERVAGTTTLGTFSYSQYDEVGRNTLLTYPDGHTRTQVWDELGRLRSRCYGAYPGGGATRCYTADYDEVGNPTLLGDPERTCTITYDDLDRLQSVTCTDGTTETYAYNALGALSTHASVAVDHQRPRLSGGGSASAGLPATHAGQPVGLDAVGKVTSLAGMTLDWNRLGRLVSTTQAGVTTTYGHDSYFRRATQQRTGSPLELYLYEGPNVAAVASGAGVASVERRFVYDGVDHPLWMWDRVADAGVYFELDCIGNVRRLRGGARYGAGAALPSDLGGYKYSAFGRSVAADAGTPAPVVDGVSFAQPLRWQGRWLDSTTGIYDVRNRQWSPELGAFLSADEFVYFHTEATLWSWPGQNPVRWRDRMGNAVSTPPGMGSDATFLGNASSWLFQQASSAWSSGEYGKATLDFSAAVATLLSALLALPDPILGADMVLTPAMLAERTALHELTKEAIAKGGGSLTKEEAELLAELAREQGLKGLVHPPHPGSAVNFPHAHIDKWNHIPICK